ncbi:MAG: TrkH family potassium uptake protein [Paracoccaceae bacterium]
MSFVFFVNGLTLILAAAFMALTAILFQETATLFAESALIAGAIGALICLASQGTPDAVRRVHAFLLTASVWMTAALAGALPLMISSLSATDAFFEAMSGITTTGSTVMTGLDDTDHGILFWRAVLQAIGGVGFIVTGIALLPFMKIGGMQLFRTESSDKGEKELRTAAQFALATLVIYVSLIAICCAIYVAGGMDFFDAVTHAMTTVSTGGYSNYDASFGHFDSAFLEWAATCFMVLGALPFAWYIRIAAKGRVRNEQVRYFSAGIVIATLTLTLWLVTVKEEPVFTALRMVAFNVISLLTTTGYATDDYTAWGAFPISAFFILTAVGGCAGSTSGGAKAMRWIIMTRCAWQEMRRTRFPHITQTLRYEGRLVDRDTLAGVMCFFTFYLITFGFLTLALASFELDFATAASGALTALANVGPGIGPIIGPAGNFATLDDGVKLILAFGMYLGRLEMLTVYVLFTAVFWREAL